MAVYRYCLTSQGLQRNTLLHAVALPLAFSPSPPLTDHQHSQTVTQTTTSPTERHLPRHTNGYIPPKSTDHLAFNHPCQPPPGATFPNEIPPLRLRTHRPRPPRTGQKQSNHTFPLSGSRGCVCLSGGSRYNNNFFSEILVTSELGYTISFLFLQKNEP